MIGTWLELLFFIYLHKWIKFGDFVFEQTRNHHWKIFVNPVGVDAIVQQTITRCVAGGYTWNPYYTQLADPLNVWFSIYVNIFFIDLLLKLDDTFLFIFQTKLYEEECGADNPLRCYVGDVSLRTSTIGTVSSINIYFIKIVVISLLI